MELLIELTSIADLRESGWFRGRARSVADPANARELDFAGELPIVGVVPPGFPLREGMPYLAQGELSRHERYGPQVNLGKRPQRLERVERLISLDGLDSYLYRMKRVLDDQCDAQDKPRLNIGPKRLRDAVQLYRGDVLSVLREDPARVAREVSGWSLAQAEGLGGVLRENEADERVIVELATLGANGALSASQQARLFEKHGRSAPGVVAADPYGLIEELDGFGWSRAELLAANLGWPGSKPARLAAALREVVLSERREGHTYTGRSSVLGAAVRLTGQPRWQCSEMLAISSSLIEDDRGRVFLAFLYSAEVNTAAAAVKANQRGRRSYRTLEADAPIVQGLNDLQRQAFELAMGGGWMTLTGGPGRGKTHTCRAVIAGLLARGRRPELLAPTGRAAARMSELTGRSAQTIHRFLQATDDKGREDVTDYIIDECSMIDVELFARFLKSLRPRQNLILVGDPDQLPPVGPGRPFLDLLNSAAVAGVHLDQVMRTDRRGLIGAAGAVNDRSANKNQIIEQLGIVASDGADGSFGWLRAEGEAAEVIILEAVAELLENGAAPDDIQVIVPRNGYRATGEPPVLSTRRLNRLLGPLLNRGGELLEAAAAGDPLRAGERVMQLKNSTQLEARGAPPGSFVAVMNGEIGRVLGMDERKGAAKLAVDFGPEPGSSLPRVVSLPAKRNDLASCYAATAHKFQGSEARHIVIAFDRSGGPILDRSWLYTAITRASSSCLLVAPADVVGACVSRPPRVVDRRTTTLEKITNKLSESSKVAAVFADGQVEGSQSAA